MYRLYNSIIFFIFIFMIVTMYHAYPIYKKYIKEILIWPEPIVKNYVIGEKLLFNKNNVITNPIKFINNIYKLNIIDCDNFVNNKTKFLKFNNAIRVEVGNTIKTQWEKITYEKINKNTVNYFHNDLAKYGIVIMTKYKRKRSFEKKWNFILRLSDILSGEYDYIYIKTDKWYVFNINFAKINVKDKYILKKLWSLFTFIVKNN